MTNLLTEENRPETWLETDFRAILLGSACIVVFLYCRFLDRATGYRLPPIADKDLSNLLNDRFYQPEHVVPWSSWQLVCKGVEAILYRALLMALSGGEESRGDDEQAVAGGFFVGRYFTDIDFLWRLNYRLNYRLNN